MRKNKPIELPEHLRKQAVASVRRFFQHELDDEIGELKAGTVLDYFLSELAPTVYNSAINDAQAYFQERVADLEGVCHHPEFQYWNPRK